jgi:hypothetical protein
MGFSALLEVGTQSPHISPMSCARIGWLHLSDFNLGIPPKSVEIYIKMVIPCSVGKSPVLWDHRGDVVASTVLGGLSQRVEPRWCPFHLNHINFQLDSWGNAAFVGDVPAITCISNSWEKLQDSSCQTWKELPLKSRAGIFWELILKRMGLWISAALIDPPTSL